MPELLKPDMPAVLERTNLAKHFGGFLLPVFEAISNSVHSISSKFGVANVQSQGKVYVRVRDAEVRTKFYLSVSDNGNGLDKKNYKEFRIPFTGNKLRKNGKGFGRFIAFKVFKSVVYHSFPADDSDQRSFSFDIYRDEELLPVPTIGDFPYNHGCRVIYRNIKKEYEARFLELDEKRFLDSITQNFLTQLTDGTMPETIIDYDGSLTNLRDHFTSVFQFKKTIEFSVPIDGSEQQFAVRVSRASRGDPFKEHGLLFFADDRILGRSRRIEGKLGKPFFQTEKGKEYVIIAGVSGSFLDQNANNDRTFLEVPEDDIKLIVDAACDAILEVEDAQHSAIKGSQKEDVASLLARHPTLRFGLEGKTIEQYVSTKPNSWKAERFVSDLAVQRHRSEKRWNAVLEAVEESDEVFEERKTELLERVSDFYRDALSEYVVHRKAVLELASRLRQYDETSRMHPEEALHGLIFPRNNDTASKKYYQHNLWLLDERLAFTSYVSSDRTLHGGRRQKGDKIADLNFYDELYVAGGEGTSAVMIVEFKKPGRDDYRLGKKGLDPIKQVRDTVAKIRKRKSFITTKGDTISVPDHHEVAAFVIADLEPSLRNLASDEYDFTTSWDEKALFHYHKKHNLYIEIFGYDKLLEDAEKRNGPFFDVLMQDIN